MTMFEMIKEICKMDEQQLNQLNQFIDDLLDGSDNQCNALLPEAVHLKD